MTTDGFLDPSRAEQLRLILSDPSDAESMVVGFNEHLSDSFSECCRNSARNILTVQAVANVQCVFQCAESPIERIFFNSFLCSCASMGIPVVVSGAPDEDFLSFLEWKIPYLEKLFCCYSFYRNLPDDCRPPTLLNFLEWTGVSTGGLSQEEAEHMYNEAVVMFEVAQVHALHVSLQPKFKSRHFKRGIRTDAITWVPSAKDCRFIIECDGYEYHSDKASFGSDRLRDRKFQEIGLSVRRYSGQEIHQQPIQAAVDLAEFLAEKVKPYGTGPDSPWESRLLLSPTCHPSREIINAWREVRP